MTDFEPPWPPLPIEGHEELGDDWANETTLKAHRDKFEQQLKGLYFGGIALWGAHRKSLSERIEAAGGIKSVEGDGLNRLILMNGESISASKILRTPQVNLSSGVRYTRHFNAEYIQTRSLRIAFCGRTMGVGLRTTDHHVNMVASGLRLDRLVEDKTLFPEAIEIQESITTTHPSLSDDGSTEQPNVTTAHYALEGALWGPNYAGTNPMPDPYEDYEAYRLWAATSDNPQLNTTFSAPRLDRQSGQFSHPVIIDRYGSFKVPGAEALEDLARFRERLTFYAFQQYPDLFTGTDPDSFGKLPKIQQAIET